jgi:hypothetical protein
LFNRFSTPKPGNYTVKAKATLEEDTDEKTTTLTVANSVEKNDGKNGSGGCDTSTGLLSVGTPLLSVLLFLASRKNKR